MKYSGTHSAAEVWHKEGLSTWPIQFFNEIEVDGLDRIRAKFKERGMPSPTYTAMVIKAVAIAIDEIRKDYPEVNGYIQSWLFFRRLHVFQDISCGFSMSVDFEGKEIVVAHSVVAPEKKSLQSISSDLQFMRTAPEKKIREFAIFYSMPRWLQGFVNGVAGFFPKLRFESRGSFNFTSVGHLGADFHSLPQSATIQVGMGGARDRVVARDGKAHVTKTFVLMLSIDRKVISGKPGALLIQRVREILHSQRLEEQF